MPNPGEEIGRRFAEITEEQVETRYREQYRAAMRVLREIPNGTADADLTPEQRQAWKDHDDALSWFRAEQDFARAEHDYYRNA